MIGFGLRAAVIILACASIGCAGMYSSPSNPQTGDPGIVVAVDAESIRSGEVLTLTVTANNRSSEPMNFGQGSSSCWFEIRIVEVESGQSVPIARVCTRDYAQRYLEPGEERTETATWRVQMFVEGETVDVPRGAYEIRAEANGRVSRPVTVKVLD